MGEIALFGYRSWASDIFKELLMERHSFLPVNTVESREPGYDQLGALNVIDPRDKAGMLTYFEEKKPELALFYGWSWIIPEEIVTRYKCVCLHPSMLPKYRGGSPIQNQIIAGEDTGGVTLFFMSTGMDDGDIIAQRTLSLAGELRDVLSRITSIGIELSKEMLAAQEAGTLETTQQDPKEITTCKRRKKEESELTPDELEKGARYLYDKIRALQDPYPNAFITTPKGKLFVIRARIADTQGDLMDKTPEFREGGDIPEGQFFLRTPDGGIMVTRSTHGT